MIKRRWLLIVLLMGITFLIVFSFSQMNRIAYQKILDRGGLSESAYVIKSQRHQSIMSVNQALKQQKKLTNYQIQYQVPNANLTYLYGAGDFKTLPLLSGRFFTDDDFQSQVPVAVVGKKVAKTLYRPAQQSYLKFKGRYISVIGVVGNKQASRLDSQVFMTTSPVQSLTNQSLNHFKIVIDGKPTLSHLSTFQHVLQAKQTKKLVTQNTPLVGRAWLKQYWWFIISSIVTLGLCLLVAEGWLFSLRQLAEKRSISAQVRHQVRWHELRGFMLSFLFSMIVTTLLAISRLYVLQYQDLISLLIFYYLVTVGYFAARLHRIGHQAAQ